MSSFPCKLHFVFLFFILFPQTSSFTDTSSYVSYPKLQNEDIALIQWKSGESPSTETSSATSVVVSYTKDYWLPKKRFENWGSIFLSKKGTCANGSFCEDKIVVVQYDGSDLAYILIGEAMMNGAVAAIVTLPMEFLQLHPQELYPVDEEGPLDGVNIPIFLVHVEGSACLLQMYKEQKTLSVSINVNDPSNPDGLVPFVELVSPKNPSVYIIHNLLPTAEVQNIKDLAKPFLRPSYIGTGSQQMRASETRTSNSTFLIKGVWKNKLQKKTAKRISSFVGISTDYFADLQVNYYQPGGKYEPHYDWVPHKYQEQVLTVLLSLSAQPKGVGGETVFPSSNPPIKVHATQGMALVFNNTIAPGIVDRYSWHGGAPLLSGEKWNANQWIFNHPVPFPRKVSLPTLLLPYGGDPPKWMMTIRNWATTNYGGNDGYIVANKIFNAILISALVLTGFSSIGIFTLLSKGFRRMKNNRQKLESKEKLG